jgi:hypothetical protein
MNESYREHPNEEALERFLLKTSSEEELEDLETHILMCGPCIERLEILQIQIAAARVALQSLEAKRYSKSPIQTSSSWKTWFTIPRLSFAATSAVAAIGAILFSIPRDVTITSDRGTETAIVSEGRPLHMHLNAAGLDPGTIAIELADNKGSILWKGTSVVKDDKLDFTLPRIVHSGPHYLRLYSPTQPDVQGVLLREFALNAKWTI